MSSSLAEHVLDARAQGASGSRPFEISGCGNSIRDAEFVIRHAPYRGRSFKVHR